MPEQQHMMQPQRQGMSNSAVAARFESASAATGEAADTGHIEEVGGKDEAWKQWPPAQRELIHGLYGKNNNAKTHGGGFRGMLNILMQQH